ncbi:MAG: hypothetical protein K9H25_17190 [Rhodospirillum sp.]|nr:hypothetical protein [Rhodospirillum sp.]MCF8501787.1 hypothetical protein [Rhodospirillum sp.]
MKPTKLLLPLIVLLLTSACAMTDVEMPENNGSGTDEMKLSPCACMPVEFNSRGFTWLG